MTRLLFAESHVGQLCTKNYDRIIADDSVRVLLESRRERSKPRRSSETKQRAAKVLDARGPAAATTRAQDPARWRGLDLLGFVLMQVREDLH